MKDRTWENGDGRSGLTQLLRTLVSGIPWSEAAERVDELHLALGDSHTVRVHNSNGRIHVIGEDRSDVGVRAHKRARAESSEAASRLLDEIDVAAQNGGSALNLDVQIPKRWNRRGSVNLEVRVPRSVHCTIEAVNGKLLIQGLRGEVSARSSNGPVAVEDVVGDVEVFTSNGKVSCQRTCGRLRARSSCGKIELADHRGAVDASTSNGFIHAALDRLGNDGVRLSTSNGRIVLHLPEAVDADVDVHVDNGVIRNDRELHNASRAVNGRLRGTLGAGGLPIRLRCSNGSISLR